MKKIRKATKTITAKKTAKSATAKKATTTTVNKASGRFPAWVKTKPQKAYVLAMRIAGSTYTSDSFKAFRKANKVK